MAQHFRWFDEWRHVPLRCEGCGWEGDLDPKAMGIHSELADFECPGCEKILAIVAYPTDAETRSATDAGNPEAAEMLTGVKAKEDRHATFTASKLSGPQQLPDLEGDVLEFVWDFEEEEDEHWIVIRCGDQTIWRELAHWEDWRRFNEVKDLLRARYGARFRSMRPTRAADLYLFGDDIGALGKIEYT